MLLANKGAVIYGAGGAIGGAVARVFALAGAKSVFQNRWRKLRQTGAQPRWRRARYIAGRRS